MAEPVLVIAGATAAGKTKLAVAVARRLGGEVVSADSRQIYQCMAIGTARPTADEMAGVPHHGLGFISPAERYSAGRFAREARAWIAGIRTRGRVPVVAGGTGFYLRALARPLFEEPDLDHLVRRRLHAVLERWTTGELRRWVEGLDPASSALDPDRRGGGGRQRLARALEVALLTGRTLGWWQRHAPALAAGVAARFVVLELPREELYRRIDRRVSAMVEQGWVDEVRGLLEAGAVETWPGITAAGYGAMLAHVRGHLSLDEAIARTRTATRQYARRQLTWLRHQVTAALRIDARVPGEEQVEAVVRYWKEAAL
jgi:tRNA dimethylallyltransferase